MHPNRNDSRFFCSLNLVELGGHADALALRYFRDVDGREGDFVILPNQEPIALVECKQPDADVSGSLRYLKLRYLPRRPSR